MINDQKSSLHDTDPGSCWRKELFSTEQFCTLFDVCLMFVNSGMNMGLTMVMSHEPSYCMGEILGVGSRAPVT